MEITASSFKLRANAPEGRKAISYQPPEGRKAISYQLETTAGSANKGKAILPQTQIIWTLDPNSNPN